MRVRQIPFPKTSYTAVSLGMNQRSITRLSIGVTVAALTLFGSYPKRYTERITIAGAGRYGEITGDAADSQFSPGGGPGFSSNGVPQLKGWIVQDWLTQLPEPSAALTRYKVTFHITSFKNFPDEKHEYYHVSYAHDSATKRGYVRLPGKGEEHYWENVKTVGRGDAFEGHWFAATHDWSVAVEAALESRASARR